MTDRSAISMPAVALLNVMLALALFLIWAGYTSDDPSGLQLLFVFIGGCVAAVSSGTVALLKIWRAVPSWMLVLHDASALAPDSAP